MATPDSARSWVAIGAERPTSIILRTKARRDIPPAFTRSKRPRKSRSSIGCLHPDRRSRPAALAILQDACKSRQRGEQAGGRPSTTGRGDTSRMPLVLWQYRRQIMTDLAAVDSVDIQILVDNVTDSLSSVPSFVETEFAGLGRRRGAAWGLGGGCLCCAAHGLACLLTIRGGDKVHTVLFDTGPEDRIFEQNASRLGIDLGAVEAMVLSHRHWDHAGAMLRALELGGDLTGGRDVACYTHPDMFRSRALKLADDSFQPIEDVTSVAALQANGGR